LRNNSGNFAKLTAKPNHRPICAFNYWHRRCLTAKQAWGSFMNLMLIVVILAISAVPLYAQEQRPNTEKLKADAQNVFKNISGDKLKIQIYCKIADLSQQLDRASRQKDTKKVEELSSEYR
jgi:hypothetical protein